MASVTASYPQILALAAAVVAIGSGVVWVYARAAGVYHRTLGSRRDLDNRLNQVAAGVTARYLEERFGAPAFVRASEIPVQRSDLELTSVQATEQVYRTRHAWLQVLTDDHDAVIRFSITVTDPRFHFQTRYLTDHNLDVKLGHTRFSSVQQAPDGRSLWTGARTDDYSESFYFGPAGNYQRYVLSSNDVGVPFSKKWSPKFLLDSEPRRVVFAVPERPRDSPTLTYQDGFLATADGKRQLPPPDARRHDPPQSIRERRSETIVNTLTVLGAGYGPATLARPRGPDNDYVGILIATPWELRQTRRRFRQLQRIVRYYLRAHPLPDEGASSGDETAPPAT